MDYCMLEGAKNNGALGGIRTHDLSLRRAALYPAELQARVTGILQGCGAEGEIRTHTPLRALRPERSASTISPPRQVATAYTLRITLCGGDGALRRNRFHLIPFASARKTICAVGRNVTMGTEIGRIESGLTRAYGRSDRLIRQEVGTFSPTLRIIMSRRSRPIRRRCSRFEMSSRSSVECGRSTIARSTCPRAPSRD